MFEPSVNAISLFVEEQFPTFYADNGPNFIIFMQMYFQWLEETNNPVWFLRNALNFSDIDKTMDDFIVHFKQKYLKDIQFQTYSNKILFIKNSLDFYRAKGSSRAIDLFFQLIYGEQADVYLPKTDILRISDGTWTKPLYIEVSDSPINNSFINQQIQGVRSGATAFVERFVKKKVGAKTINIFFISNLVGNFETNELLMGTTAGLQPQAPVMIGSLTELEIIEGGLNFNIGDQVNLLNSDNQISGLALVTGLNSITGIVQFTLLDGGYGYNNTTSLAIVSDKVFALSNVVITSNTIDIPYLYFEQFIQPLANIEFNALTGGTYAVGENVYTYDISNVLQGIATILSVSQNVSSGVGNAVIAQISGNIALGLTTLYLAGNVGATSNLLLFTDTTVTSNVMGVSSNITLYITNSFGSWTNGINIFQGSAQGYINRAIPVGGDIILYITNVGGGVFYTNSSVYSSVANGTAYSMDTSIGVIDISNTFTNLPFNYVYGANSLTTATINTISFGTDANFEIGMIDNKEQFTIAINFIGGNNVANVPFVDIRLDGANSGMNINAYGFERLAIANLSSLLIRTFGEIEFTDNIGTIQTLAGINPGQDYSAAPFVLVYDPFIAQKGLYDYLMVINDLTANFQIGEQIEEQITVANSVSLIVNNASTTISYFTVNGIGVSYTNGDLVSANSPGVNAIANITTFANGSINYLIITNWGSGYIPTSIPVVKITNATGGTSTGSGANVTAIASDFLFGDYVYESNGLANIATGVIQLKNISNGDGLLQINSVSGTFTTAFNLIGFASNTTANITAVNSSPFIVGAKGLIKAGSNTSFMYVRRLSYENSFVANDTIVGLSSGATANVVYVNPDLSSNVIGWDADIEANVIAANGSVSNLQVLDSGFGYTNGQIIAFESLDGTLTGLARALVLHQGFGAGYYTSSRGFLSDNKIVQDDYYWQEFSYEVRTNVPLDTYSDIFKKVMHVAGTQLFGAVYLTSNTAINISAITSNSDDFILTIAQPS